MLEQSNRALQENAELRAELTMLKAVQPPEYDNLAGLDDVVRIRFKVEYRTVRSSAIYSDETADLKLLDIFVRVAADLSIAKTALSISAAVKQLVKEKSGGSSPHEIHHMDLAMLKAQFMALGLISAQIGTSVQNTFQEYLSLTPKGTRVFMESIVVRKRPTA